MTIIDLLGIVAGICTTLSLVPQIVKIHTTKRTRDLSLSMFLIFTVGVALWLVYGFIINKAPIIIANLVTINFCGYLIWAKIRYN
ncbi:MAG: SemiSWEET transporter [Candidatus Omnitrophica bacterium]|nr:SemiSWEET transporter [Candidatus Omnitrophota bacterium]